MLTPTNSVVWELLFVICLWQRLTQKRKTVNVKQVLIKFWDFVFKVSFLAGTGSPVYWKYIYKLVAVINLYCV